MPASDSTATRVAGTPRSAKVWSLFVWACVEALLRAMVVTPMREGVVLPGATWLPGGAIAALGG